MFAPESVKRILACAAAIVFMAGGVGVAAREAPRAQNGAIDLRDWDFARDGIVELAGEWTLQRGQFRDPALPDSADQGVPIAVPGPRNAEMINGQPAGAEGHGTYFLTVACGRAEDLDMPVMGGYQAAALIRDHESRVGRARCTIVALSSHDDDATKRRCVASGFDRYLVKPVAREVLHRTLRDVVATDTTTGPEVERERPACNAPVVVDGDIEDALPQFLASRRSALDQFDEAFHAGDADQLRRIAHRLAGSFAMYGFLWAAETCSAMEARASRGETQGLGQSAAALRHHLATVEIRVRRGASGPDAQGEEEALTVPSAAVPGN